MEFTDEIEDAGCDWLTMTWPLADERLSHIKLAVSARMDEIQTGGNKAKETKRMQYQGVRAGRLFFGIDETHAYLEATSAEANVTSKRIIAGKLGGKATRADLQATAPYAERAPDFFKELRERLGGHHTGGEKRRAQKGAYYFSPGRDTGISVGSGSNERNFRAYSAREGGHPDASENAVRFEAQYRQVRARQVWAKMEEAPSLENLACRVVANECRALGIMEPWMDKTMPQRLEPIKNKRDIESAFKWYRSQIFPSFAKTISQGYGEQLLNELKSVIDQALEESRQPAALELSAYKTLFGD
jgi:hypothetical protein